MIPQSILDMIVCPGCGWAGKLDLLPEHGACPVCDYENGAEPYRLLTLAEMLVAPAAERGQWNDVDMGPFLRTIFNMLRQHVKDLHVLNTELNNALHQARQELAQTHGPVSYRFEPSYSILHDDNPDPMEHLSHAAD